MPRGGGGTAPGGRRVPVPGIAPKPSSLTVGAGGLRLSSWLRFGGGTGVLNRGQSFSSGISVGRRGGSVCLGSSVGTWGSRALLPSASRNSGTRQAGSQCFQPVCQTQACEEILPFARDERRSEREIAGFMPCVLAQRQLFGSTASYRPFCGEAKCLGHP